MKKEVLWKLVLITLVLSVSILPACGAPGQTTEESSAPETGGKADFTTLGLKFDTPYDPVITMDSVISVDATIKFHQGDDIYDNVWTRAYRELLGIDVNYQWVVDASQYEQKLNATIMSGEIPDMFRCNSQLIRLLHESDLIQDLSSVYGDFASDNTKDIMAQDPIALKAASIEGSLMGIPLTDASIASAPLLWVRQDWMEKMDIAVPGSMDDVLEIAQRFAQEDPNNSGLDDTIGLAVSQELWGAIAGLQGFFNGYHAYPRIWFDQDGKLTYGSVQPEMREALLALQDMYSQGQIDREFGVKDVNKVSETIANSQCGMQYGVWWNPYQPLQLSQQNDPNAYWQAFPLPSIDSRPAKSQYSSAVSQFLVVGKDFANPEALLKMVNFWTDNILRTENQDIRDTFLSVIETPDIIYYKYTPIQIWEPNAMIRGNKVLRDALASRDPSPLNLDEQWRYQIILAYFDQGIKEAWVEVATNGDGGSVSILQEIAEGRGIMNQYYGAPTPVMAEKMATLQTMEDEVITRVIMGAPIEDFDQFVTDWYQMGGQDIIDEVNEWQASQ